MRRKKRTAITCDNCNHPAIISSVARLSNRVVNKYCSCTNVAACGCTFVITEAFSHYLNPPLATTRQIAFDLIMQMPKDEREKLQGDLFG
jgi:hypothetical protein